MKFPPIQIHSKAREILRTAATAIGGRPFEDNELYYQNPEGYDRAVQATGVILMGFQALYSRNELHAAFEKAVREDGLGLHSPEAIHTLQANPEAYVINKLMEAINT